MKPIISVRNLSKKYIIGENIHGQGARTFRDIFDHKTKRLFRRDVKRSKEDTTLWALKDMSFDVDQGEVVGIIGRNGAGKSTLLKILSRITEPTEGDVTLRGRVASLLEVGTGFSGELTGRENIFLNGSILGMKKKEIIQKFDEIVAFAEVEKFIDTPVKRYSSGMYVRLAFAVAAHLEPEILIVDEVLAVGDAAFQKKCLGKMGDVAKEGRTVLFVSHQMPSIQALCSRVILLIRGNLAQDGEPLKVISGYLLAGVNDTGKKIVDLTTFPGRTISAEIAIQQVWLENGEGNLCNCIPMGGRLDICYRFETSKPVHNPGFGFGVEDMHGRRIFSVNNYSVGSPLPHSCLKGVTRCVVPSVPLQPGRYLISISLVEDHRKYVDYLERVVSFTVEPADVFGTGKILDSSQGIIFVPAKVVLED